MPAIHVVLYYLLFNIIHFYMNLHGREFKGASMGFETILNSWVFLAMLAKYGFVIYWGLAHGWIQAAILFGATLVMMPFHAIFGKRIEKQLPSLPFLLSLSGFIALPVLGVLLVMEG